MQSSVNFVEQIESSCFRQSSGTKTQINSFSNHLATVTDLSDWLFGLWNHQKTRWEVIKMFITNISILRIGTQINTGQVADSEMIDLISILSKVMYMKTEGCSYKTVSLSRIPSAISNAPQLTCKYACHTAVDCLPSGTRF